MRCGRSRVEKEAATLERIEVEFTKQHNKQCFFPFQECFNSTQFHKNASRTMHSHVVLILSLPEDQDQLYIFLSTTSSAFASIAFHSLTRMKHFIPCNAIRDTEEVARLYEQNVWKLHGLLVTIISDRGPQFVSVS
jgi:hypothetical protein